MSLARGGSIEVGEEVSDCYLRGTMGVHVYKYLTRETHVTLMVT
jgi:hypothetical protein